MHFFLLTSYTLTVEEELSTAFTLIEKHQYDQAIKILEEIKLSSSFDQLPEVYYGLGYAYFRSKNFGKALSNLNNILHLDRDGHFHYLAGLVYSFQGDYNRANKFFEVASSQNKEFLGTFAENYYRLGKFDKARTFFCRAIEHTEDMIRSISFSSSVLCEYYVDLGFYYTRVSNYSKAIEYFEKAILLNPECSLAWNNLSWVNGLNTLPKTMMTQ